MVSYSYEFKIVEEKAKMPKIMRNGGVSKIIAIIMLVIALPLCFVGCNENEQPATVEFSSTNYMDYIAINVVFDSPAIVPVYASTGTQIGNHLYCNGTVKVAKNNDCQFINCSFTVSVTCTGWPHKNSILGESIIQLSYDGEGESTFTVYKYYSGEMDLTVPVVSKITVTNVEGTVVLN